MMCRRLGADEKTNLHFCDIVLLLQEGKPCSGEKLLLMFDRWRKLAKAFYSEKKNQFDISKASASSTALLVVESACRSWCRVGQWLPQSNNLATPVWSICHKTCAT